MTNHGALCNFKTTLLSMKPQTIFASLVFHCAINLRLILCCTVYIALSEVMVDLGKKGGGAAMKDQSC